MKTPNIIHKPDCKWHERYRININKVIMALGKTIIDAQAGGGFAATKDILGILGAVELKGKSWQEQAWTLIERATEMAVIDVVNEACHRKTFAELQNLSETEFKSLSKKLQDAIGETAVEINQDFINDPCSNKILPVIQSALEGWLTKNGWTQETASNIGDRLRSRFREAFSAEQLATPDNYANFQKVAESEFLKHYDQGSARKKYLKFLGDLPHERVFKDSGLSYKDIYIPLRAYRVKPDDEKREGSESRQQKNEALWLHDHLKAWIKESYADDCLRVITGGPGCGKSMALRMFAGEMAEVPGWQTILIPLQNLRAARTLEEFVKKFCTPRWNSPRPVSPFDINDPILLLLDGLDELMCSGLSGAKQAGEFVSNIVEALALHNQDVARLKIILTGRSSIIQSQLGNINDRNAILHVLPLFIEEQQLKDIAPVEDTEDILSKDMRLDWWAKYSTNMGKENADIPNKLDTDHLRPLTAEPLLIYLITTLYQQEEKRALIEQACNKNQVYRILLDDVYWRPHGRRPGATAATKKNDHRLALNPGRHKTNRYGIFKNTFAAIALSAWQQGGARRTTRNHVLQIEEHLGFMNPAPDLAGLSHDDQPFYNLLAAFYCKEYEDCDDGDKGIEFTHKSFGEFLSSQAIVDYIACLVGKEKTEDKSKKHMDLIQWAKLFGPAPLTDEIILFLREEILHRSDTHKKTRKKGTADQITKCLDAATAQHIMADLISHMLEYGMPMTKLQQNSSSCERGQNAATDEQPLPSFKTMNEQARNAEEALLVILSLLAGATGEISHIAWPSDSKTALGAWLNRLMSTPQTYATMSHTPLPLKHLNHFHAAEQILSGQNLRRANLEGAHLEWANLWEAHLEGAHLEGANLEGANLEGAHLERAHLEGAHLRGANLRVANLEGAHLERAHLEGAHLRGANLRVANLEGAHLEEANLERAHLEGANLEEAHLEGAHLGRAHLEEAHLEGAHLEGAHLEGAHLEGANLRGATLSPDALTKEQWAQVKYKPDDPLD